MNLKVISKGSPDGRCILYEHHQGITKYDTYVMYITNIMSLGIYSKEQLVFV